MSDDREKVKQDTEVSEWHVFKERYGDDWMLGEAPMGELAAYEGLVVLDLGSGPRKRIEYIPARLKIKLDCCMVAYKQEDLLPASEPGEAQLLQALGEALPFADGSIDCIHCLNTLDHCLDPERVVEECRRVLVHGGEMHVHVDLGGEPTPCEPIVFTEERLNTLFFGFEILHGETAEPSHEHRTQQVQLVLRKP